MRSIDIHAHLTPQAFWRATENGGDWHSLRREKDAKGQECAIVGGRRQVLPPRARWDPEAGETLVTPRSTRYHLPNSIGNLVDRAVTFATLVSGGVMDQFPDLKICLGHGGGYTCYGIGRMDHGWKVRAEARVNITRPPSTYLRSFYYDCIVYTEPALRFLVDTVGADRVLFGTDWPYDMALDWPVSWILEMKTLSQEEKEAILWKNLEKLLRL